MSVNHLTDKALMGATGSEAKDWSQPSLTSSRGKHEEADFHSGSHGVCRFQRFRAGGVSRRSADHGQHEVRNEEKRKEEERKEGQENREEGRKEGRNEEGRHEEVSRLRRNEGRAPVPAFFIAN